MKKSDAINRDKVLSLVLDVCNDVMDECETVTGTCGEEVYTDVREVDAILKCNKRIRNGIRQLPSEPVGNTDTLEWIPCSEEIPDSEVLCCDDVGHIMIGYVFSEADGYVAESEGVIMFNVVAWMSLPKPYKKEKEE